MWHFICKHKAPFFHSFYINCNWIPQLPGSSWSISFEAGSIAPSIESLFGAEGSGSAGPQTPLAGGAVCGAALRVLRQMVATWLRDVALHQNAHADLLIVHFYRFLLDK